MAQLPPKPPSMAHNWPSSFPFQMIAPPPPPPPQNNNSWVDEFLEFSSARRSNHRRSASCDSIAFVEAPLPFAEQCRNSINSNPAGFEGLDDEQLRNMFSDDIGGGAASNPSTPSDQNSDVNNDEKNGGKEQYNLQPKNEPGESQMHSPSSNGGGSGGDAAVTDPKRIKRILANRQSAQRSRVRKLQYISELERSVTTLQTEVSVLSPRVAFLDHQRLILNVDNSALKQRIAALAQDKIFKDAHQEALRKEIERLRQIYHEQTVKRMANKNNESTPTQPPQPAAPPASQPQPQPSFNNGGCTDQ